MNKKNLREGQLLMSLRVCLNTCLSNCLSIRLGVGVVIILSALLPVHAIDIESDTLFPAKIDVSSATNDSKVETSSSLTIGDAAQNPNRLDILSTADIDQFKPIILDFQRERPTIEIRYVTASSTEVMAALQAEEFVFDVAISSAMDLHTKLANDGYAQAYESAQTIAAPDFARWRNEVFTFSEEPAAIVLSEDAFEGLGVPQTRQELITLLRNNPNRFRGKIGTYDVRQSGLGYLFASQDSRNSDIYWRLTEVMGSLGVKTYCCSSDMISDVASGKVAIAYNVLGSYAKTRVEQGAPIQIVLPEDYTLLMQRSVLIPRNSGKQALAGSFVDHLLRLAWQSEETDAYPFPRMLNAGDESQPSYLPIRLGPGLLVFLDKFKRRRFIEEWEDSVLQE